MSVNQNLPKNPNRKKDRPKEVDLPRTAPEKPITRHYEAPRYIPRERPIKAPVEKPAPHTLKIYWLK